jgi:hypothetical protein
LPDVVQSDDLELAVLRAQVALAERHPNDVSLAGRAASLATERGRFDLACEAWIVLGQAARRQDPDLAATALGTALQLSSTHHLLVWQVRALAELGRLDRTKASDPTRFLQARPLAVRSGMAGTVAELDLSIGACVAMRDGFVPAFPIFARADARASQLHLIGLHARTRSRLCSVSSMPRTIHCLAGRVPRIRRRLTLS